MSTLDQSLEESTVPEITDEALIYPPDEDDNEQESQTEIKDKTNQQTTKTPQFTTDLINIRQTYNNEVKKLAQQSAFHVEFTDETKKIYKRRKVSMKEVEELEEKRALMKQSTGTPKEIRQALHEFYWFSTLYHLRETKTNKPMTRQQFDNVVFEDFRKLIDACEFVMLFGVPS